MNTSPEKTILVVDDEFDIVNVCGMWIHTSAEKH
jgi:hypothetical protein